MNNKLLLFCIFAFYNIQECPAQTWTPINPHTAYNVTAVNFLNDSVGFIGGGIWSGPSGINSTFLKKTVDKGQHFSVVFDSSGYTPIHQLHFYTEQYGLIKRWQDAVNVTHDGGQTDTSILSAGCGAAASKFQVLDSNTIYLYEPNCNSNGIAMTSDNGQNWTFNNGMASIGANVIGNFLNSDTGIISNGNNVYRTWNKGLNWDSIYNTPVNQIICINNFIVVMITNYSILQSQNFGNTWNTVYAGLHPYSIMEYKDNLLLVASDSGVFLKSYDWGSHWIVDSPPTTEHITGISIVDGFHEIFYITGNNGTMFRHINLTAGLNEAHLRSDDQSSVVYFSDSELRIRTLDLSVSYLSVFDITGKIILARVINGSENISLSLPAPGVYVYSLKNNVKLKRGKFFID